MHGDVTSKGVVYWGWKSCMENILPGRVLVLVLVPVHPIRESATGIFLLNSQMTDRSLHLPSPPPLSHCDREAARPPQPNTAANGARVFCDAGVGLGCCLVLLAAAMAVKSVHLRS